MLDFLGDFIKGILGLLLQFLPDSPIQGWIDGVDALQTALGWLNWLVPVGDMVGIFLLFLGLLAAWAAVRLVLGKAFGVTGRLVAS